MNTLAFLIAYHWASLFFGLAVFLFILTATGRFDSTLTKYLAWAAMATALLCLTS